MATMVLAVGVFALLGSLRHAFYTEFGPDAGFFPLWVGLLQTVVGAALVLQLLYASQEAKLRQSLGWRQAKVASLSIAFVLLLGVLGFTLATFLFVFVVVSGVERRSLRGAAFYAAGSSAAMALLFDYAFGLRLPRGIIF
jgi:hypothetical protein